MLSDVYFPRVSGVSTSIETFRAALAKLDIQVTLVVPDYPCRRSAAMNGASSGCRREQCRVILKIA
jgi:hypothetical protein